MDSPKQKFSSEKMTFKILGAGVVGLTTALELAARYPLARIQILATHLPGDRSINYTSPWAGANWLSVATDNGRQENWDRVTYKKFEELADGKGNESGVKRMPIWAFYDSEKEDAGILSQGTGKVWYEGMAGLRWLKEKEEMREGAKLGYEAKSFVVNVQVYLPWLQNEALKKGVEMLRTTVTDIRELTNDSDVKAVFNCTGLGSYSLKGVEDKLLYPTRGQVMLVENPKTPMERMYFRSPQRVNKDTTYVFPRNPGGGVILGGCRFDNEWDGEVDLEFAEDIKRRCCALAPELGKPEDLKVIQHAVGLRPSRKGGPRLERESMGKTMVIHNYGAGGAGYQASWGLAKDAVDLL
ncbi:putative D-amino acid oxidase [Mollisia scopiformis]|uniref:Putative D-amino acid oxidase n=1 Tax=Mollisia scopiformis TaxID=149040 RepID=A0A194WWV4_MOLSC|nr:putative D-amino acid oxidase [Mollisia scopiformis]KUJ12415.1 putative D-amino acid oxidase [Mollisia scopiformis]